MKVKNKIIVKPYLSPCGVLLLGSFRDKLCLCDWRGPALAEAVQDGFLVEHGLLFGCTALSFLFLRPLQESGFQCIDRSDDYRVGLS